MDTSRKRRGVALIVVAVVAGLAYSAFLVNVWTPSGGTDVTTVVSSLEVSGPHAGLLRAADVVSGILVLILVPYLHRALPPGPWRPVAVWSTVVFAVAGGLSGVVPLPCAEGSPGCADDASGSLQAAVHDGLTIVSTVAILACMVAVALAVRGTGPRWLAWAGWLSFGFAAVTGIVTALSDLADRDTSVGVAQRLQVLGVTVWIVLLGVYLAAEGVRAASVEQTLARRPS